MTTELDAGLAWLDGHINLEATAGKVAGLSLDRMRTLLAYLGDPQSGLTAIHVTGTNGKGSTAAMAAGLLTGAGLSVGTYASPHVSTINERIAVGGEPIADDDLAGLLADLRRVEGVLPSPPSWFELVTAAALSWFADRAVDVAVVEVGKLGRYDATNVLGADVVVVTTIGEDHTDGAPGWRRAVAWEKAGIISPGSTLVLGEEDPALRDVFLDEAPGVVRVRGEDVVVRRNRLAVGGRLIDVSLPMGDHDDVYVPLHGAHQGDNAALALAAVEEMLGRSLGEEVIADGLARVRMPGRFEVLAHEPLVVIDGAHNPDGAAMAAATLADDFAPAGSVFLVVGLMADKRPEQMLTALRAHRSAVMVATEPPWPRALPAAELGAQARSLGIDVEVVPDPAEAVRRAAALATPDDAIFVAGSLYLVGAVRDRIEDLIA